MIKINLTFQTKPLHRDVEFIRGDIEAALKDGRINKTCRCDSVQAAAATDPLGSHYAVLVKCHCGQLSTRIAGTTSSD